MSDETLGLYKKAGRILASALKKARYKVHVGMPLTELCDLVEYEIKVGGAEPAFPCNVSINNIAAHDTADINDERTIPPNSIVKIDGGAHIEGYIVDSAITVSFDPSYERLLLAAQKALLNALEVIKPGTSLREIGKTVENTIRNYGYKPISNLTGHQISRYVLHAGKIIPNVYSFLEHGEVLEGEIYAIEPFATNGRGEVHDLNYARIYALLSKPKKINDEVDELATKIWNERRGLPFTPRWYLKDYNNIKRLIDEMLKKRIAMKYPVLTEINNSYVSQFEHTIYVTKDGVLSFTEID
jgi:methionyl aminopeptidase